MTIQKDPGARPPVVVVMGHIDHGKSTLLDYIRKTNITAKEEGGITQHISAYEVMCEVGGQKRKITFLDTPGHEAFCSMRERGSRVADIAVLVVSAEDGVKPQTIEALNCILKDGVPFVVAINKIDKAGISIDKIKQNLAENNVLVEGWGGNIPVVPLSAKTGQNVAELLEIIALQSDIEELKGNPEIPAEGFVIESDLNPKQGISATLIVKNGTLRTGDFVATEGAYLKVRSIEDFQGKTLSEASFSSPIRLVGWNMPPLVGKPFKTFEDRDGALKFAGTKEKLIHNDSDDLGSDDAAVSLGLVVKADTFGSLDAVIHEVKKLSNEKVSVKIVSKGIGAITEKDIKSASFKKSHVIGFNVIADKSAEIFSMRENVEVKTFKIIYDLVDFIKEKVKEATPVATTEVIVGSAKILKVFSQNKDKQVLGGRMEEGEIKGGNLVKIFRREVQIGEGKMKEIQVQKVKTNIASDNQEFGMMIESKTALAQGDMIRASSFVKQE